MINKTMKLPEYCVGFGMTCPSVTSDLPAFEKFSSAH